MKTLLLTLVVLTIVCVDLGHTRDCYEGDKPKTVVKCKIGENLCFTTILSDKTIRGCAHRCPPKSSCCAANRCNRF
uniref:Three-finger toxin n=1 Tax=Calliophis bivirgatus TaxID=8633 RepID=A0A898IKW1_CALBG|nr:three-finger toxin [Calliophis bivirgatus]